MSSYIHLGRKSKLPEQLKRGHDFRKTNGNIKVRQQGVMTEKTRTKK